jgi:hypothetical protein
VSTTVLTSHKTAKIFAHETLYQLSYTPDFVSKNYRGRADFLKRKRLDMSFIADVADSIMPSTSNLAKDLLGNSS